MRKDGVCVQTVVWGVVIVFGAVVLAFMIPVWRVGPFGGIVQVGPEAFGLVLDKVETGGGR
jgi:hypothetical protein